MFDKFKQLQELKKMRDQAMLVKRKLEQIVLTIKRGEIEVEISADQRIRKILVEEKERHDLKDAINEALKKSQEAAAKEMQGMMGGVLPGM